MADKLRYVVTNVLGTATISSSSEAAGLPDGNIVTSLVRQVTRTTNNKSQWWVFDAGAATGADVAFVGNHNFTANATVKVQANAADTWGSPSVDETLTIVQDDQGNVIPKTAKFWTSVQSYRYWRLLVEDLGNATSALQVGIFFAGRATEPSQNLSDGFQRRVVDPSRGRPTAGRQQYWNVRTPYLEFSYDVAYAPKAQRQEFEAIYNAVGKHAPFVFATAPESEPVRDTVFGQFESDASMPHVNLDVHHLSGMVVQEKN